MDYDMNLGVWQTEDCVRCGGCCTVARIQDDCVEKPWDSRCQNLQIDREEGTSCLLHNDGKPRACSDFFCSQWDPQYRLLVADVVLDDYQMKPVENAEEIRDTLREMVKEEKVLRYLP